MKFLKNLGTFFVVFVLTFLIMEFYLTQTEIMQPLGGEVDEKTGVCIFSRSGLCNVY